MRRKVRYTCLNPSSLDGPAHKIKKNLKRTRLAEKQTSLAAECNFKFLKNEELSHTCFFASYVAAPKKVAFKVLWFMFTN